MFEKLSTEVVLILIGSTIIILMLIGLFMISLFISQKRKYRHQHEKKGLEDTFKRELLQSQLEIQSQAFESISRELHDNIGTLLSIAIVHLRSFTDHRYQERSEELSQTESLLNEAMDSLRDISKSLNPENIQRTGWQQALVQELDRLKALQLFAVHYTSDGNTFLIDIPRQVIIFRILQEALHNIVKHSNAANVHVDLSFVLNTVTVHIRDDGDGFTPIHSTDSINGSGLNNMRARAAMLPAHFQIESTPGQGSHISLTYTEPST